MKVIFSRKGFDSKYGGNCSPIMPDQRLISLPIPVGRREIGIGYDQIFVDLRQRYSYKDLMDDLGIFADPEGCHFDPDLRTSALKRKPNWKQLFGQSDGSRTHLIDTEKVGDNDLLLFFGTFRRTYVNQNGNLTFEPDHSRHIIFGYMLIDTYWDLGKLGIDQFKLDNPDKEWAFDHPHFSDAYKNTKKNVVFVPQSQFSSVKKGAGVFKYNEKLCLTKEGYQKRNWELLNIFDPKYMRISNHQDENRFRHINNDNILLQTVDVGQEFVVTPRDKSSEKLLEEWVTELIEKSEVFD